MVDKIQAKAALKREEQYLQSIQKALEHQLGVLRAEQVVLERQIIHHKHEEHQDTSRKRSLSSDNESDASLPELRLEIDQSRKTITAQEQEEFEEEMED